MSEQPEELIDGVQSTSPSPRRNSKKDRYKPNTDIHDIIPLDASVTQMIKKHKAILNESTKLSAKLYYVSFFVAFIYAMRVNVLILYALTFENSSFETIGIMRYGSYIVFALQSVAYGIIGDKWRFDNLLVVTCFLDTITFFMEAFTTSFAVLIVAVVIGMFVFYFFLFSNYLACFFWI